MKLISHATIESFIYYCTEKSRSFWVTHLYLHVICTKIKELVCFQFQDIGDFVSSGFGVMGF